MAPTIHFVRHAQGYHNLSIANEDLQDPDLTPRGLQQCADLRAAFPHHDKVTTLIASPMRRTLYTCLNGFGHNNKALLPIKAMPVFQEMSLAACDIGTAVPKLAAEFGDKVDLSRVEESWTEKGSNSPYEPTLEKLLARGKNGRLALREIAGQGDDHIVVVAHGGILHFLTDDWQGDEDEHATGWTNCEYRSYQFVDPNGKDEDAALHETPESWRRRHGETVRLTPMEQQELRPMMIERMSPYITVKN